METRVVTSLIDEIRRPHTFRERAADAVARRVGSWTFILSQTGVLVVWVVINSILLVSWDPYPFMLMNVVLSLQAAYTAPIIMMSQNRQGTIDRKEAHLDYEVNRLTRRGVEQIQEAVERNVEQLAEIRSFLIVGETRDLSTQLDEIRTMVETLAGCSGCCDRLKAHHRSGATSDQRRSIPPSSPFSETGAEGDTDGSGRYSHTNRNRTF
jgi:uncharacterized membrane protein